MVHKKAVRHPSSNSVSTKIIEVNCEYEDFCKRGWQGVTRRRSFCQPSRLRSDAPYWRRYLGPSKRSQGSDRSSATRRRTRRQFHRHCGFVRTLCKRGTDCRGVVSLSERFSDCDQRWVESARSESVDARCNSLSPSESSRGQPQKTPFGSHRRLPTAYSRPGRVFRCFG